jgi:hypothetical protein
MAQEHRNTLRDKMTTSTVALALTAARLVREAEQAFRDVELAALEMEEVDTDIVAAARALKRLSRVARREAVILARKTDAAATDAWHTEHYPYQCQYDLL